LLCTALEMEIQNVRDQDLVGRHHPKLKKQHIANLSNFYYKPKDKNIGQS